MNKRQRIAAFAALGKQILKELENGVLEESIDEAIRDNKWFTKENCEKAISAIAIKYLSSENLEKWLEPYNIEEKERITIGVVMAGNIPLVGWHDALSVLITGNNLQAKLSSKDKVLPRLLLNKLIEIEPEFADNIETPDILKNFDAVIATGSGNTARYFEYYFGKYPHIIRKNRTSAAVLSGKESSAELMKLGADIFDYYGLGCRNVSHIYIPEGYNLENLLDNLESFKGIAQHNKYFNNYEYHKSLLLLNKEVHLDNGFLLLKEDEALASPVAMLYYSYYKNIYELQEKLEAMQEQIQCVSGNNIPIAGIIPLGEAQNPELWQYADNVDTIATIISWRKKK
jgi:hypothetical protein